MGGRAGPARRAAQAGAVSIALLLAGSLLAAPAQRASSLLNRRAPEFTRRDLNGATVDLARLRGKVVLLDFWATWCAPCEVEMPAFSAWQRKYGAQGLQVVGISMDDSPAPVRRAVGRLKPAYPVAMGDAQLGELYGGVMGLPLVFLIDRRGVVRARYQGETDLKRIETRMRELLAER
ncbi:MAG TPA: TlpA disulfide reductase family protein [Terracidiphilus sp.]|nr:TlpA disulfide reductase family protein [Terracidiphilus sp.]